jgi:mRNA interferase HicA
MTGREFERWLASKGCTFEETRGKGGHIIVRLGDKWTTLPRHGGKRDMGDRLMNQIKKQLGLK